MATNVWTASYLIAQLKRYGFLGANSSLSDSDFISMLNDEAQTHVTALIKSVREQHLEVEEDVAIASGTASYQIPARAVANGLSLVSLLSAQSVPVTLPRIDTAQVQNYGATGTPAAYETFGAAIVLHPTPVAAGTLRLRYIRRLSRVVPEDECGLISAINTGTNVVTISAAVTGLTSSTPLDLVRGSPGFDNLAIDRTATVASTSLTFASLPSGLAVGDYVALANETPIPQVPVELFPLLSKRVALAVATATSSPNLKALSEEVKQLTDAALGLMTPRVSYAAKPIINYSGPGWRRWPW